MICCQKCAADLARLKELAKLASVKGSSDFDGYLRGMANGLILAVAVIEGADPEYLEHPERYLHGDVFKGGRAAMNDAYESALLEGALSCAVEWSAERRIGRAIL